MSEEKKHEFQITLTYSEIIDLVALVRSFVKMIPKGLGEMEKARLRAVEVRLAEAANELSKDMTADELSNELTQRVKGLFLSTAELIKRVKETTDASKN